MRTEKTITIAALIFILVGVGSAAQPKIVAVEDNFDNQFNYTDYLDGSGIEISTHSKILVKDNMTVNLCINEVKAQNPESLNIKWDAIRPRESDIQTIDDQGKCATWIVDKEDYQSRWTFRAFVDNGDDIQPAGDTDFMAGISYRNLSLDNEQDNSERHTYNTVQISQKEYRGLQKSVEDKKERIRELESRINVLEAHIRELNQTEDDSNPENKTQSGDQSGFIPFLKSIF